MVPGAVLFDPEDIGSLLYRWVPARESGDFRDLPVWRRLTADTATALAAAYDTPVIVPMTVVNSEYRREFLEAIEKAGGRLLHIFLEVSAEELRRRIETQVLFEDMAQDEGPGHSGWLTSTVASQLAPR